MTDKGTSKVLGLFVLDSTIDGTKVLLENSDKSAEQMWYRSVSNSKGYFTLKNPMTGKFLTASSPKTTSMKDQQSEIMYEPKVEIDFVQRPRPKGQLISEWLFDLLNFPKNQLKKFDEFLP